jgi:dienelactone hydrolase
MIVLLSISRKWRSWLLLLPLVAGVGLPASAADKTVPQSQKTAYYLSGGKKIGVEIYEPSKPGRFPAIVILHGSNGPMSNFVDGFAQQLADQGYVLAMIHYFDKTGTTAYPSYALMQKNFPAWVQTVRDGISFLDQHPRVKKDDVGLLGVSLGGFVSSSVGSSDPRVKAVVNVSGGIPEEIAKAAKKMAPTLILHGDADQTVPVQQAYALESVLKRTQTPYEIEIYPGQGHMFRGEAQFDAMTRTLGFLDEHLRAQLGK